MKNKSNYILIAVFILMILVLIFMLNKSAKKEETINLKDEKNYELVTNYSDFYTVLGCANKYFSYLSSSDKSSLLKVLNEKYLNDNEIDENNILTILDNFNNKNIYLIANKMYEEKITKNNYKYYIKGILYEDKLKGPNKIGDYYLIVIMDKNDNLFNITPYDGSIFKEEK